MNESPNVDAAEIAHFNRMAELWWDPQGKMGQLHAINGLRLDFIVSRIAAARPRVADVGCGGGILAEAMGGEPGRAKRVFEAMMTMKKIDIAAIEAAWKKGAPA